ncbi:FAD/NAD(P)-binding domain-containing protein [Tothia fuscella]|uniref:FAD/NAD(P)-binding domain-containing protein n=1 Tax=Tothia fuscella TaxID=1048955 RepID=A0A9P4NKH5_9PEZI|nr:FAD/NAD(P)-binding domain-containing protein [Tothia fuscella]
MEDLVVVGAGWNGLMMAKTYLAVNPSHKVTIVDGSSSIGGVWAKERLYPTLLTNNLLGTFEWSDFPMRPETFGVKPGEHMSGEVVHEYLTSFAEKFDLTRRILLESKVKTVEYVAEDNTWILTVESTNRQSFTITAERLVIATGLTSEPNLPTFPGTDSFGQPIFHFADFGKHFSTTETTKKVAILGGAKSAWDAAYSYAAAGVQVDMIIRKSGGGPHWMSPPYVTPFKLWLEKLVFTRFLMWFSPCIWGDADGFPRIRKFLHGTAFGRWLVDKYFVSSGKDTETLNEFDKHEEVKKLKPWTEAIWVGGMLSILNYPTNFFDLVKSGMIKVHIEDVVELSPGSIHLSNGEALKVDLLCCATGWKAVSSIKFLPAGIEKELGLPHLDYEFEQDPLTVEADSQIVAQFPRLANQPDWSTNGARPAVDGTNLLTASRPFELYRFMIPPAFASRRNFGFCGMLMTISTPLISQTQALWLTAYFTGSIDPLSAQSLDAIKWETRLHNRFRRWRHPTALGLEFPDFIFDTIPYIDMLLHDLKLASHRKGNVLLEIFGSYGPKDYRGLVEEWLAIR